MKTTKMIKKMTTFAVATLGVALTVGQAHAVKWVQLPPGSFNKPYKKVVLPPGAIKCPNCPKKPTPPANNNTNNTTQPEVNNYYYRERGFGWGEFAGGTALGLVMGTMANQPQQTTQPQVVYVQQPTSDTNTREAELKLEIERERAKARALELEIERLRAERQE